jgi:putative CocE/NonD family hydrolase
MRVLDALPCPIREIENTWIPLADGCRLAARLWLPEGAESAPVPAIIEYIPYRKRDGTRARDEAMHRYFAGHGYAAVRIDLRGSGESDGLLLDEYLDQEQEDGVEAIAWIAAQPWCNGAIGMIGKSWGGFNALQIASRRPPQLKAVMAVCAADDRYADDVHYMGGCLLNENLTWGSVLFTLNALPPDPTLVGARWRAMWRERLEHDLPFPLIWLRHQRRDAYWQRGSVCEDFSRIACPVYAAGGWADGYSNAVPRLIGNLTTPCKGLVGPWGHRYPYDGRPGPAIGFLQEALRWWDHWLRGIDTGVMEEPRYRVWMPAAGTPLNLLEDQRGRWIAEPVWPSPDIVLRRLYPGRHGLSETQPPPGEYPVRSPQTTGLAAGRWCAFGFEGELPLDQREDDSKSVCFDSEPLTEPLELLGAARVELIVAADCPVAMLAVRLNDVAPDGCSARISYGLLNLTHRASHAHPEPLRPGEIYRITMLLNDTAHGVAAGHRLRLAVSTCYWPVAWPAPYRARVTLYSGGSSLTIPVRRPRSTDEMLRPFDPPEIAPIDPITGLNHIESTRDITRDPVTGRTTYLTRVDVDENGALALERIEPIGLTTGHGLSECFEIDESDPLSAHAVVTQAAEANRHGWSTRVETRMAFSSTAEHFHLRARLKALERDRTVFEREWDERVPRDHL